MKIRTILCIAIVLLAAADVESQQDRSKSNASPMNGSVGEPTDISSPYRNERTLLRWPPRWF